MIVLEPLTRFLLLFFRQLLIDQRLSITDDVWRLVGKSLVSICHLLALTPFQTSNLRALLSRVFACQLICFQIILLLADVLETRTNHAHAVFQVAHVRHFERLLAGHILFVSLLGFGDVVVRACVVVVCESNVLVWILAACLFVNDLITVRVHT